MNYKLGKKSSKDKNNCLIIENKTEINDPCNKAKYMKTYFSHISINKIDKLVNKEKNYHQFIQIPFS